MILNRVVAFLIMFSIAFGLIISFSVLRVFGGRAVRGGNGDATRDVGKHQS